MLTFDQAYRLFLYADRAMSLLGLAALATALWWGLYAALPQNKGRRKRLLLRALVCSLVVALYYGTQWSVLIAHFNQHLTPLLTVLFVLPIVVMSLGIIASVAYAILAILRAEGIRRRSLMLRSLLGLIVCVVGIAPHTTTILIPIVVWEDHANRPGTLTRIGHSAPNFEITDVDGKVFRTADLRGRVTVVTFFATWCGPCQKELPHLQATWSELQDNDDFRILAIGREESDDSLKAFRSERGFTFPMASDGNAAVFHKFASHSIPRTYLISRQGTILYQCTGYYETEISRLGKLLRKELVKRDQ